MSKHIVGSFLIHADAAFLNGAGLGAGENKNTVIPKTLRQNVSGRNVKVPYVSAQAFRRWLRNTSNEDNKWMPSELEAIGKSDKGSTNKLSTKLDPVNYPEDDIFGYMKAGAGKEESVQRTSPFRNSILKAIVGATLSTDKGYVHLKEGTPVPYDTDFYVAHLQGIFGIDIERLGRFENLASRVELSKDNVKKYTEDGKIKEIETNKYELSDRDSEIKKRVSGVMSSLARLRGGSKMAAFGTDVTPKAIIMAQIEGGNLIFNDLFEHGEVNVKIKTEVLKDILKDFSDRIDGKVYIGARKDYVENYSELENISNVEFGNVYEITQKFLKDKGYAIS